MLRRNFMWNIWFLSTEISRQVFPQRCWNFLIRENARWSLLHDMIRLPASFFLHKLASLICKHLKPNSIAYDCFHVKYLILFDILGPQQKSCKIGARMTCNCLILSNSNHCFTWNIYAAVSACTNFGLSPDMFSDTKVLHWFSWAACQDIVSRFAKTASIAPNDPIHRSKAKMFPKLMPTRFD